MATLIQFRRRSPAICSEITEAQAEAAQAEAAQAARFDIMGACPRCTGRGVVFFKRADGRPDFLPCPCGGTDADRIEINDFDGAA